MKTRGPIIEELPMDGEFHKVKIWFAIGEEEDPSYFSKAIVLRFKPDDLWDIADGCAVPELLLRPRIDTGRPYPLE